MADSTDSIRKAAADAIKSGGDVARRVQEVTLEALRNRRFDREGIREVVRAVSEGMAAAAPASGGTVRQVMGQAFRGMDEALTKSVEAGEKALRQLVSTGRGMADHEVKDALAGLKKIEQDFIETVSKVASSASCTTPPCAVSLACTLTIWRGATPTWACPNSGTDGCCRSSRPTLHITATSCWTRRSAS